MAGVVLENVWKKFNDVIAVENISLEIRDREFLVLVGPSGCGKTTTLRMIAGLEEISEGKIYIDGKVVNDVPPKDRDIAMVFQNYALYPHMKVFDNMAFGLRLRKLPKKEIERRVAEAAEILDLSKLLDRYPKQLSGGQKQRVAVGRAIVRNPKVFLMDEPLSNLDAKLRVTMRAELKKIHNTLQATIVYVTHDQVEAMTLGDRIAVILNGQLQQVDKPLSIYEKPSNRFVAGFIGSPPMNFIKGKLEKSDGVVRFVASDIEVPIPADLVSHEVEKSLDQEVVFGIRPVDVWDEASSDWIKEKIKIQAKVDFRELMGSETYLYSDVGRTRLVARVSPTSDVTPGHVTPLMINLRKIHLFDPNTQAAII